MALKRFVFLLAGVLPFFLASRAHADAIVLLSSQGSTYVYGLTFSNASTQFNQHQTITITGLSGVSSVSPSQFASYLGYTSSSNDSVTLTMAGNGTYAAGSTQVLYTVVGGSPALNLGQYTIQEASTVESGSVVVTPEPASLLLIATGVVVFALSAGYMRSRSARLARVS